MLFNLVCVIVFRRYVFSRLRPENAFSAVAYMQWQVQLATDTSWAIYYWMVAYQYSHGRHVHGFQALCKQYHSIVPEAATAASVSCDSFTGGGSSGGGTVFYCGTSKRERFTANLSIAIAIVSH